MLPFVLGLLMVLGIGAALILYNTGSNLRQASKDAGGLIVESLALSAIEEGLHRFQTGVNDPESKLFRAVRKALIEGNETELDLSEACDPETLRDLLKNSEHAGFYRQVEIESFRGKLSVPARLAALKRLDPEEAARAPRTGEQYVDFDCAVSLNLQGRTVWRRVLMRRRYGITFISPYKPFDQFTFAIISSGFLESYPEVIGRSSQMMLNSNRAGRFLETLQQLVTTTPEGERIRIRPQLVPTGRPPAIPGEAQRQVGERLAELRRNDPDFEERFRAMEPNEQGWFRWSLVAEHEATFIDRPAGEPGDSGNLALPGWPGLNLRALATDLPLPNSVLFSTEDEVDLADFDYDRRLVDTVEPQFDRLDAAFEVYNRVTVALMGKSERPLDVSEVESYFSSLESPAQELERAMPQAVRAMNEITYDLNAHSTTGLTSEVFDSYLASTSRRLQNLAFHTDNQEDLENLRSRLPVFNGHVNYNGTEPFHLELDAWRGKTVFSAPWRTVSVPITIGNVSTVDSERDRVCLNYSECHFVGRKIQAAVFVQDRGFYDSAPKFEGNLILRRLRVRSERMAGEDLRGTVTWDPRVASGRFWKRRRSKGEKAFDEIPEDLDLAHYTVGLCPRFQQRAVFRTPEAVEAALGEGEKS